jgi:hypothetical protein
MGSAPDECAGLRNLRFAILECFDDAEVAFLFDLFARLGIPVCTWSQL